MLPRAAQMASVGGEIVHCESKNWSQSECWKFVALTLISIICGARSPVETLRSSIWVRFCGNIQAGVKNVQYYAILGNKHILRCWLFHEFARLGLMSDDDAWACKCRLTKKGCQQHQKYPSVSVISRLFAYSIFVFIFFMNYNHAKKIHSLTSNHLPVHVSVEHSGRCQTRKLRREKQTNLRSAKLKVL